MSKKCRKIKRKIGALIGVVIFVVIVISGTFTAQTWPATSETSDVSYRIIIDNDDNNDVPDEVFAVWHDGDGVGDDGTELFRIVETGRVGIGDTSPDFKLEVTGSSGSGYLGVSSSSDGDIFIIDSNGKVGIGTTTPGSTLEIKSSGSGMTSALHVKNSASTSLLYVRDDGDIGIGTTTPDAKLDVELSSGSAAEIGSSSCSATGNYAVALGDGTIASGLCSVAMGQNTEATSSGSIATGMYTDATGYDSTAMGYFTEASGDFSTAMGYYSEASGDTSTAMGRYTTASGDFSTAMGWDTTAGGVYSTAMGNQITVNGAYSFGIGLDYYTRTLSQANTMAIMGGKVGIGTVGPSSTLEVNGDVELMNLYDNDASNFFDGGASASQTVTGITSTGALQTTAISISEDQVTDEIESVTAGNGLTGGGTSGDVTLNVGEGNGITVNPDAITIKLKTPSGLEVDGNGLALADSVAGNGLTITGKILAVGAGDDIVVNANEVALMNNIDVTTILAADENGLSLKDDGSNLGIFIKDQGNVGIGTTSPNNKLTVSGDADFTGNVGIGTTSPGTRNLQIKDTLSNVYSSLVTSSTNIAWLMFGDTDNDGMGGVRYLNSDDSMEFYVNQGTRVAIKSNGNVGIGTTTPATKLDVNGVITATSGNSDQWNTAYSWGDHSDAGYLTSESDPQVGANTLNYVPKWDGSALVTGTIYDNGNVGIGTTSPGAKLDVEVSSGGAATIGSSSNSATGDCAIAMGYNTIADYNFATAMGYYTTAGAPYSTAMGDHTTASGWGSTAIGLHTTAAGQGSIAMGYKITVEGDYSFGIGLDGISRTLTPDNTMAIMGGNVGIGTTDPAARLDVAGDIIVDNTIKAHGATGLRLAPDDGIPRVYITDSGNVGIGSMDPDPYKLKVGGDVRITGFLEVDEWVATDYFIFGAGKLFRINHTLNESKYLQHASLEGPEFGVIYRGNGTLVNGNATIYLPDYYNSLTMNNSYTVQLTARGSTPFTLSYDSFNETAFVVHGSVQSGEFDWEVKATRDDIDPLEVEPDKEPA